MTSFNLLPIVFIIISASSLLAAIYLLLPERWREKLFERIEKDENDG